MPHHFPPPQQKNVNFDLCMLFRSIPCIQCAMCVLIKLQWPIHMAHYSRKHPAHMQPYYKFATGPPTNWHFLFSMISAAMNSIPLPTICELITPMKHPIIAPLHIQAFMLNLYLLPALYNPRSADAAVDTALLLLDYNPDRRMQQWTSLCSF